MIKDLFFCIGYFHPHPLTDTSKIILSSILTLTVGLTLYIIKTIYDQYKRKIEMRETICSEIYFICEKILRYAVHSSSRSLVAKYYYTMHKIEQDEDFDKLSHMKYLNDAENSSFSLVLNEGELISKIAQLEIYWKNSNEIKKIKELANKDGDNILMKHDGVFNKKMNRFQTLLVYTRRMNEIQNFVTTISRGKYIIEIQNIVYPNSKIVRTAQI